MTVARRRLLVVAASLLAMVSAPDARAQTVAESRTARVERAELAARRGDRATATRDANALLAEYRRSSAGWSARDHVAAGRAYLLVSGSDAGAVRSALKAFDAGTAADPAFHEAALRASDLLLDKYNGPDAKVGYESVLKQDPRNAWATLGLARVMEFSGQGDALGKAREALAIDPKLVPAHLFIAKLHLEAERNDSAQVAARRAIAVDSTVLDAWAVLGAVAYVTGDSTGYQRIHAQAVRLTPRPAAFYVTLSEACARQRRYGDAERFAEAALTLDSLSVPALGAVGTNELRTGDIKSGRARIEKAFAIDPFNLWHKNTLDLLDVLAGFKTVRLGRFEFVATPREADILLPYLAPLLDEAYEKLAARYEYKPQEPIRLEIYQRHADFSVRTVGLTGLGALGVSFGRVLAMDAPSARDPGTFNWGSTAWHELAHTFTLGLSGNRTPRWFSEGASVLEERRARRGWGAEATGPYLAALRANQLRPVSQLNDGFVRPRNPMEVGLSYYHASLVCEMIESKFGPNALASMLRAWRDGLSTEAVFQRVLKTDIVAFDKQFDTWVKAKFEGVRITEEPEGDAAIAPLRDEVRAREAAKDDRGLVDALERLLWIWPYDAGTHVKLAEAAARIGEHEKAVRERRVIIALGPTDVLGARVELARALLGAGDRTAARREVLSVLEQAPTFEKAQMLLLDIRKATPPGGVQ
jgi:tetratricopeptide (TPR) repeat protein